MNTWLQLSKEESKQFVPCRIDPDVIHKHDSDDRARGMKKADFFKMLEARRCVLLARLKEQQLTVRALARSIDAQPEVIRNDLVVMRRNGLVAKEEMRSGALWRAV